MKRLIFGFGVFCMLATMIAGRAAVTGFESHVYMNNQSDAWVWVTAYSKYQCEGGGQWTNHCVGGGSEGAWCVAPSTFDKHGLHARIYEVRAEVSRARCQGHPVVLNLLRGFPYSGYNNTMTYYVHGANGHYVYGSN